MQNVVTGYLFWFVTTLIAGVIFTPVMGRLAVAIGLIDKPSKRKFHLTTMPLMGGVAVFLAFAGALVAGVVVLSFESTQVKQLLSVLIASTFMMVLGIIDDKRNIAPKVKLAGQTIATVIICSSDLKTFITPIPAIDYILTLIWIVGIINCLNLLDNIDGLAGGTAAIVSVFFFIAAVVTGNVALAFAAVIFTAACLGFLFHNFHPASIFSGDAGSMFMGTIIASFGLMIMKDGDMVTHLSAGVMLGLLIFDTGLVSFYRVRNGYRITDGGKDHTSHRLCSLGMSIQGSVIALFCASVFFGLCGVAMLLLPRPYSYAVPCVLLTIMVAAGVFLKDTYNYDNHNPRK